MKFISNVPNITVWDEAGKKPIQFENGVYETKDYRIAFLLKNMGFKCEDQEPTK